MKRIPPAYIIEKGRAALSALGGWLGWYTGGLDGLMTALLAFMALDYMTGVMCAIARKELSSAVGFRGICRKALILMLVGMGHALDARVVGGGAALRTAVICFYLANEGISVLENAARLGLPLPGQLRAALGQLHAGDKGALDLPAGANGADAKSRPAAGAGPNARSSEDLSGSSDAES